MLCIFTTAGPQVHSRRALDLPVVAHGRNIPRIARYDSITIVATRDGSVYFRNTKVLRKDLPNRIYDAVLNGAEKRVYLKVDARGKYGDVSALPPYVQSAGIQDATFPVETPGKLAL